MWIQVRAGLNIAMAADFSVWQSIRWTQGSDSVGSLIPALYTWAAAKHRQKTVVCPGCVWGGEGVGGKRGGRDRQQAINGLGAWAADLRGFHAHGSQGEPP